LLAIRLYTNHIERVHVPLAVPTTYAEPPTLTNREPQNTIVATHHTAVYVDNLARPARLRSELLDNPCIVAIGHEANVLTIRFVAD